MQSIIPAPVWSRSSLTRLALIVVLTALSPPSRPCCGSPLAPARPPEARLGRRASCVSARLVVRLRHPRPRLGWRRRELGRRDLRLPGRDAVRDDLRDQVRRADRIVVSGDDEVGLVRVGVGVDQADDRDAEAARLAHRQLLLLQVDDEDRVRLALHVGDSAEVRLELLELGRERDPLLRGKQVELSLRLQAAQVVEVRDPLGDRAPVREQAAEPAVGDVRHADARRVLLHGLLRLLLRADEEDGAAALGDVAREVVRLLEQLEGLLEVDDVDASALGEDEAAHLRVPASRLVAEVDAGLQELSHGYD